MKKVLNSLLITAFTSMMLLLAPASKVQAQDVTVSYQDFYDELSPYGQWVYDPDYGNVWVPNEDQDFRPYYSRGHWVMTDYGNMWASDDPWGWACYHYGRWTYNGYYGWIWVPGYEWAPAWVSWRYGGGYAGWAPLSPGISVGISYGCPDSWWVFVGPQYLYTPNYYNYWRGPAYNRTYISQTTIINNVYVDNRTHVQYNYGPRASTIQATTHAPVQVYRVSQGNRPGVTSIQRNTVSVYRPNVNRNTYTTARPQNVVQAPRNIGRPEAAVPQGGGNRQPAFRQDVQRGNVVPVRGNPQQSAPARQGNPANRFDQRPTPGRQEPQRFEPQRNNSQPQQPTRQEPQRFEPQRNNPQPGRQEPQRFEPQRNNPQPQQPVRQEPQRFEPQRNPQQDRPEPQRFEPQRNNPVRQEPQRFEPQRSNPQPQQPVRQDPQRFEPQRSNPQPQPQRAPEQPRPQMQQPRPQPAPAPAPAPRPQPQQQEQRGGGRR
jgi:hypothetical protein